jgi:hypothetical protein
MSAWSRSTIAAVLVFLPALSPSVVAADAPSRLVAKTLAEVDEDFAFQGEYYGEVRAVDGRRVLFGLQVVALGDGQFSALGYQGGLPGNGWDQENFMTCRGARQTDELTLSGERGTVIIRQGAGRVIDAAGQEVGRVRKVQRTSITLGAAAPPNAIVLFDGTNVAKFEQGTLTEEGWLAPGAVTKLPVRDFRLHLEFQTPYMPFAREQARGNSGVYIQRRYEVQILDSFGLLPEFNDCGALYRQQGPDLNMTFPPLAWQTYDIDFTAARWDAEGNKTADASITVMHNGVPIHRRRAVLTKTGSGQPESAYDGPILLQDHGNPVRFRNVWLVARDRTSLPRPRPATELHETTLCEPRGGGSGWWLWRGM